MNKKKFMIPMGILLLALIISYVYIFFLPGVWHGNAFLYKKSDGTFAGSDLQHKYVMQRIPTEVGTDFFFTVDGKTEQYRFCYNAEAPILHIYKDGMITFEGNVVYNGSGYMLKDADQNLLEIGVSGVILITEEAFPTYTKLLNWSLSSEEYDIRGNIVIFYILIAAVVCLCLSYLLPRLLQASPHSGFAHRAKRLRPILWGATVILAVLSLIIH